MSHKKPEDVIQNLGGSTSVPPGGSASALALLHSQLTGRQLQILSLMDAENEELVYERGVGYVGTTRVHWRTLQGLLRVCAISLDPYSEVGKFERYRLNETGRDLLATASRIRGTSPDPTGGTAPSPNPKETE